MNTPEEVINSMTLNGLVAKLPDVQLDPKLYGKVKSQMEKIGGKWKGGKTYGFVFTSDPASHFAKLRDGEKVNLKQEYQFFPTPDAVADRMAALLKWTEGMTVLEPSAGQGALISGVRRWYDRTVHVNCFELMPENREVLSKMPRVNVLGDDFLEAPPLFLHDCIIANPPFTNNQDIDHIRKMFEWLRPGGTLVTLASTSWMHGSQKKQEHFRDLVNTWASVNEVLPAGTFKEAGTNVETVLLRFPHIPF
ncbi:MAG: class I SAM-dependent methyltransferase [Acidobacteriota bacterium]